MAGKRAAPITFDGVYDPGVVQVDCSPSIGLQGHTSSAAYLGPGIKYMHCGNDAIIWYRPSLGMEHSIQNIVAADSLPTSASIYGFGTKSSSTDLVGILCTFQVTVTQYTDIVINGPCALSINGYPPEKDVTYTIFAAGFTTVIFPKAQP